MTDYSFILITAISVGFIHTLLGPDHYLPFIALSKTCKWGYKKTAIITLICGIGHVGSSVIIGLVGILFGISLDFLVNLESFRGDFAAWLLLVFGFTYFVWGLHIAFRKEAHTHTHKHDILTHIHPHSHEEEHIHLHTNKGVVASWSMFIIFIFGPCEPLIPIIMYPAAKMNIYYTVFVAAAFSITTLITMLTIVLISTFGLMRVDTEKFSKYSHALAGFTILVCGVMIKFAGL